MEIGLIIEGIIILALLGYIVFKDYQVGKERRELLTAVLSKNSIEFATATKIVEKEEPKEEVQPEFISQDSLDTDEFVAGLRKTTLEEEDGQSN